jgi:hypothetical protein
MIGGVIIGTFPQIKSQNQVSAIMTWKVSNAVTRLTRHRFGDMRSRTWIGLLDHQRFAAFSHQFPDPALQSLCSTFPIFDQLLLQSQLRYIYSQPMFCLPIPDLQKLFFAKLQSNSCMSEVSKLLTLFQTIPMSSSEAERSFSALKRVKTYLRNTMSEERLNHVAILSCEKSLVKSLSRFENFHKRVIDDYATRKQRRAELFYK